MLTRAYDNLIMALALLAGVMIASVFFFIVFDVTLRTTGFRPPEFVSAVSEYVLLYVTMLAAPWLVRERGHVRIASFLSFAPPHIRRLADQIVVLVCAALCLVAAYFAGGLGIDFWQRGALDIRSIAIPRWLLFLPLTIGFGLCALEFLRILVLDQRSSTDEYGDPIDGEI